MAYLDENPPARSQFRYPRRAEPSGVVVVHTAENTPDYVAFDGGAEAVARFVQGRSDPGSYHDLADSDSAIQLVRYDAEAYHDATGSNPHSYGVSVATRADVWALAPIGWRAGAVRQAAAAAARYAAWLLDHHGVVIPARRITREQSEARMPGFISHAERDPKRRSDPGAAFPWAAFLAEFARLTNQQEDEMSAAEVAAINRRIDELSTRERATQALVTEGFADIKEQLNALLAPYGMEVADRYGVPTPVDEGGKVVGPVWRMQTDLVTGRRPRPGEGHNPDVAEPVDPTDPS